MQDAVDERAEIVAKAARERQSAEETAAQNAATLQVGEITGDRIVVKEGLEGGQAIAISGVHLLDEGMVVTELEQSDETRK